MKILIAADVSQSFANSSEGIDNTWFNIDELASLVPLAGAEINLIYVKEELPSYERVLATQADFPEDIGNIIEAQARPVLEELASRLTGTGAKEDIFRFG